MESGNNKLQSGLKSRQALKFKLTTALFMTAGIGLLIYVVFITLSNLSTSIRVNAGVGLHGAKTINAANIIVNEYTTLTANAAAGAVQIDVASTTINANGRFVLPLQAGELLLIIQMQGASINTPNAASYGNITSYNNCGQFEFVEVESIIVGKINLSTGLKYSYSSASKVQIVRVPRYSTLTINAPGSLTAPAWNGSQGGIVAVEANNGVILNGSINVSNLGFKGGLPHNISMVPGNHGAYVSALTTAGAEKGESIAGSQTDYDASGGRYSRGAPANGGGGGNSNNASGGGGANGGNLAAWDGKGNPPLTVAVWSFAWNLESAGFAAHTSSGGGRGGYTWSNNINVPLVTGPNNGAWGGDSRWNSGGFGGRPLTAASGKIFMGGGGGAGDENNNVGTRGGDGGGIVFILSGNGITGTGTINANGENAPNFVGPSPMDAVGGGGGGGSVFIYNTNGSISSININAKGGNGGSINETGFPSTRAEGAGGGGGGGYIIYSTPGTPVTNVAGGLYGVTNAITMILFTPDGATSGGAGTVAFNPANPYTTATPLPVDLILFTLTRINNYVEVKWTTASEINNDYFVIERGGADKIFEKTGTVKGAGNSTETKNYSFSDLRPAHGINFYRLLQVDHNGHSVYSKTLAIDFNVKSSDFKVYPNPASDILYCTVNLKKGEKVSIKIINTLGKTVLFIDNKNAIDGKNVFECNIGSLSKGVYHASVSTEFEPVGNEIFIKN